VVLGAALEVARRAARVPIVVLLLGGVARVRPADA